jgi:hypothetical protein
VGGGGGKAIPVTDGSEVASLTRWPPFTARRFLVLTSVRGWVKPRVIVWLEGLDQLKNPMTPQGNKPVTFHLVAQCLNQDSKKAYYSVLLEIWHRHLFRRLFQDFWMWSSMGAGTNTVNTQEFQHTIGTV